jgi:hypothetical protein
MVERIIVCGMVAGALLAGGAAPATAEEVRQQLNAPMILNLLARPVETPETAFNAALKNDTGAPRARRADEPEVLSDGSVRYGDGSRGVTMTIRNPCPPGDLEHEALYYPRPLPGRARR